MAKVKYYFDSEDLEYKRIKSKKGKKIGGIFLWILSSALFGLIGFWILENTSLLDTPKGRIQKREIENLKFRYKLLNKKMEHIDEVLQEIAERDNNLYRTYFNADPISLEQRKAGFGGINRYKDLEGFEYSDLLINTTKQIDIISKELVIQSKSLDEIYGLAQSQEKLFAAIPAIQPIKNEHLKRLASGFGYRTDPFTKIKKFHSGMDFSAKEGTPAYVTGDGIVERADNLMSGYGNLVIVDHGFGYRTYYAHLSRYNVKKGDRLKRGDIVGFVGSTGRSQGPHLHYEVRVNGEPINPVHFYYGSISAKEFEEISKLSKQENQSLD